MPIFIGSTTDNANIVATAASIAFPPAVSISAPAADPNACVDAATPSYPTTGRFSGLNVTGAFSRHR